jgi:hypothetical protein
MISETSLPSGSLATLPSPSSPRSFTFSYNGSPAWHFFRKEGEWTIRETAKYVAFVLAHGPQMEGKPHQQLWPTYKQMSASIKSRNFRQCKLKHQRMLVEHGSIAGIAEYAKANQKMSGLLKEYASKLVG